MSHYRRVQPIGYYLNTAPAYYQNTPNGAWLQTYLGHLGDGSDIADRCRRMAHAIDRAAASDAIDKDSSTLKVFMGPEFYFRGTKGAYPLEMLSTIAERLRETTSRSQFRNWLFVLGTMIGGFDTGDGIEVFNVALIMKGGVSDPGAKDANGRPYSIVSYKEMISRIDFIADDGRTHKSHAEMYGQVWGSGKRLLGTQGSRTRTDAAFAVAFPTAPGEAGGAPPTLPPQDFRGSAVSRESEDNANGLTGGALFEMDGVRFGLEVCLDHAFARVRSLFPRPDESGLQVQLVPSAGMTISRENVAVVPGGIVFNVDGGGPTGSSGGEAYGKDADNHPVHIAGAHADVRVREKGAFALKRLASKKTEPIRLTSSDAFLFTEEGNVALYPSLDLPGLGVWDRFWNALT
jgi:hypothetical protein